MLGRNKQGGFTIIEVMIFLAVSGLLLIISSLAISGKQAQADFYLGVGDFKSKLDDVINDISTGYYPDVGNYDCSYGGGIGSDITFSSSGNTQATHQDCVFLGKVLYFDTNSSHTGTDNYSIFTVAGGRQNVGRANISTLAEAKPQAVDGSPTNLTVKMNLNRGMVVTQVFVDKQPSSGFGIFTSLPEASASLISGALTSDLITIPGAIEGDTSPTMINNIDQIKNTSGLITYEPKVVICLRQGTVHSASSRRAAIVIGSNNRQITTEQHIGDIDSTAVTNFLPPGAKCL